MFLRVLCTQETDPLALTVGYYRGTYLLLGVLKESGIDVKKEIGRSSWRKLKHGGEEKENEKECVPGLETYT